MRSRVGRSQAWLSLLALPLGALVADTARASEPLPQRADRIPTPGKSAVTDDTADAIVVNPANVGNLSAAQLRATIVACPDSAQKVNCGQSYALATPLFLGIATGLRFDYVQPPWAGPGVGVSSTFRGSDYSWLTWAVGMGQSQPLSIGFSLQHAYSPNPLVNGLWGVTAGMTYRPNAFFGFAAIAHDFNGPSTQPLPSTGLPVLDRSYVLAMALRPAGTRAVEIDGEMRYLEGSAQWLPRAVLGIDVPGLGRIRGDIEAAHLPNDTYRGVVASAGLEINYDHFAVGGGAIFGNGLGTSNTVAEYATVSIQGWLDPARIPMPTHAVSIRIESTPGTRAHIELLKNLWRIADDKEIAGVALILRAEPAASYAHAEELADALRVLRAHGKKTLCSFEDNGAKSLYVCANADRIVVNPAGGVRWAGHATSYMYLAGLLEKLGIHADFVRVSDHKSAPEEFMNTGPSATARADHIDLLNNVEAVFNRDVAQGRHLTDQRVHEIAQNGPFVATEARQAGLVDGYAFDDEIERVMQELTRTNVHLDKYQEETIAPDVMGPRARVGVLIVDGDIVDGRSQTIPIVDTKLVGSYSVVDNIKQLRDDPLVKAVVLRIESPGGSSMASDVMWRELVLLGQRKPLIVSMGSVAASGGYYIASPGKIIFAEPLTVTGSIGVFYGKPDVSELLKKIGVNIATYKTAPRADAESLYRGFTPEERKELEHKVFQFYDTFLDRVSQGRHMTKEEVDAVGRGRVWMGQQAIQKHLVDRLGGLREALAAARELGGLPSDSPIEELPRAESTLFERVVKAAIGVDAKSFAGSMIIDGLPVQMRSMLRAIAPLVVVAQDKPMSRLEWVTLEDEAQTP